MPSTISKRATESGGRTFAKGKGARSGEVYRKWLTLSDGSPVFRLKMSKKSDAYKEAFRVLKSAGLCYGGALKRKADEPAEMRKLLKSLGAQKLTAEERRRFKAHFSK